MAPLSSRLLSGASSTAHQKKSQVSGLGQQGIHSQLNQFLPVWPCTYLLVSPDLFPNPRNCNERSPSNSEYEWCPAHNRVSIDSLLFLLMMQILLWELKSSRHFLVASHMTPIKWRHAGYQIHSSFWSRRKPQEDLQSSLARVAVLGLYFTVVECLRERQKRVFSTSCQAFCLVLWHACHVDSSVQSCYKIN